MSKGQPDSASSLPGCGLASYAVLLLVLFLVALVVMLASTAGLLLGGGQAGPAKLRPGTEVGVWQLAPMREAGVAGLTEIPAAWHDESETRDGTRACALFTDRLVRVEDGVGHTIDLDHAVAAEGVGDEFTGLDVVLRDPDRQITCRFGPEEGGIRLLRQLQTELERRGHPAEHGG